MESPWKTAAEESSQLLKALFPWQWFYGLCGMALPPCLIWDQKLSQKVWVLAWFLYLLYVGFLNFLVAELVWESNTILDMFVRDYVLDEVTKILSALQTYDIICVQLAVLWSMVGGRKTLRQIQLLVGQLERDIYAYQFSLEDKCDLFKERCSSFARRLFWQCAVFLIIHSILLGYAKFPLLWFTFSTFKKLWVLLSFHLMHAKCSEYRTILHLLDELISALQYGLRNLKYEIRRHELLGATETTLHEKLRSHQFLLSRYWYLVQLVEDYFSLPMLIFFLYNGLNIIHSINWIYVRTFLHLELDTKHPHRVTYIILLFANIMWNCWLSQICIDK
uniref:Gustatory receptor n=1 Tax=Musca domestica TaxID=7370 RepID=A0A1I8MWK0_MUSDO